MIYFREESIPDRGDGVSRSGRLLKGRGNMVREGDNMNSLWQLIDVFFSTYSVTEPHPLFEQVLDGHHQIEHDAVDGHQTETDTTSHQTETDTIDDHQTETDTVDNHQTETDTAASHQTETDTVDDRQTETDTAASHQTETDTVDDHQTGPKSHLIVGTNSVLKTIPAEIVAERRQQNQARKTLCMYKTEKRDTLQLNGETDNRLQVPLSKGRRKT